MLGGQLAVIVWFLSGLKRDVTHLKEDFKEMKDDLAAHKRDDTGRMGEHDRQITRLEERRPARRGTRRGT